MIVKLDEPTLPETNELKERINNQALYVFVRRSHIEPRAIPTNFESGKVRFYGAAKPVYPFDQMLVGDRIEVDIRDLKKIREATYRANVTFAARFVVNRRDDVGVCECIRVE